MIARRLRQYFITGLLVWLPMAVTIWVLTWLYGLLDGIFLTVLGAADAVIPGLHTLADALRAIPGFGALSITVVLVVSGVFVANIFGQWWLRQWDQLMNRIPVVRSIYTSVKQVSDTLFFGQRPRVFQSLADPLPAHRGLGHGFPDGQAGWRGGQQARWRVRERVHPDHAQPDLRLFHDAAASPCDRARHVRGQRAQVHHFHGRGGARWSGQSGHPNPLKHFYANWRTLRPDQKAKKCPRCVLPIAVW